MRTTVFDLIRHGEPAGGQMYRGHKDDPLSQQGWQQMRDAISADDEWDHILTSPLLRCREFSAELAREKNLPFTVAHDFKEISFGDWEGKPVNRWRRNTAIIRPTSGAMQKATHRVMRKPFRIFINVLVKPGHYGRKP